MSADDWTEKYRPQGLKDIVGNPTSAETMRQWALSWEKGIPRYRALVLIGTPGIGKTSSAEALAREMGWGIVEMNASDQRTGGAIQEVALRASYYNTFDSDGSFKNTKTGGRKLIVLDEADSLYGNADRGAMPVIVDLIKTTLQPVILICNDFYELSRRSSAIKTDTMQITFRKPQANSIKRVILQICAKERVAISPEAAQTIADNANGDLRAAIRDLQSVAMGNKEITQETASRVSGRESRSDMFEFIHVLLKKRDAALARQLLRECDVDPATVSVWIDENLPKNCATRADLAGAYDALSRADVYLGRVGKRMYYGLWSYANDMMVDGITEALKTPTMGFERVNFPTYLSKMSRSRSTRATRKAVATKLGTLVHTSAGTVLSESIDYFKQMAAVDADFRVMLVKEAALEPEELAFLLDCKADDKRVKAAMLTAHPPEPKEPKVRKTSKKKAETAELEVAPKKKAEPVEKPKAAPEPAAAPEPPKEPETVPEPKPVETVVKATEQAPSPAPEKKEPEPTKAAEPVPEAPKEEPPKPKPESKTVRQKSLFDF